MAFQSEAALLSHVSYCHSETGQVYEVPKPNAVVAFEPRRKSFKLGYMFFFDFETLQVRERDRVWESNHARQRLAVAEADFQNLRGVSAECGVQIQRFAGDRG